MLYFSAMVLAPQAFFYAPLLLPCAIGNGAVAGATYSIADAVAGGPKALAEFKIGGLLPVAGPAIGAATAVVAPFTYPACFAITWPSLSQGLTSAALDVESYNFIYELCYNEVMLPCLTITGGVSGLVIQSVLQPIVIGQEGGDWRKLAGVVSIALAVALGAMYSTAVRTRVPHLQDIDFDAADMEAAKSFWSRKVECYVRGTDELCWVPGLDPVSGAICSRQRPMKIPTGQTSSAIDFTWDHCRECVGLTQAALSHDLRQKARDRRIRCYDSAKAAYFGAIGHLALADDTLQKIATHIPEAQTVLTDAVVLLAAGRVEHATLRDSLQQLMPLLVESGLARSLRGSLNPLHYSWADHKSAEQAVNALLDDLCVRASELRELLRVKRGGQSKPHLMPQYSPVQLERSLRDAGIEVERAQHTLDAIGFSVDDGREQDLMRLRARDVEQRWKNLGAAAIGGAFLIAAGIAATVASKFNRQ